MTDHETSVVAKRLAARAKERIELRMGGMGLPAKDVLAVCEDNARLRAELATMHKVVIDALAILIESTREADIQEAISILETAPEPSDEVLALIEANEDEQQ